MTRLTIIAALFLSAAVLQDAPAAAQEWYETYDFQSQGVVAFWPFDIDVLDHGGNDASGSWTPGGSLTTGVLRGAYQFTPGVYYRVDHSDALRGPFSALTLAAWFRPTAAPADNESLLGSGIDGIFIDEQQFYLFILRNAPAGTRGFTGSYVTDNDDFFGVPHAAIPNYEHAWHHLATTWDGNVAKTYLNGDLVGTQSNATGIITIDDSNPFYINRHDWSGSWSSRLSGLIDDAVVFDRALDQDEIGRLASDENHDGIADFWVTSIEEQFETLIDAVIEFVPHHGVSNSLLAKIDAALDALSAEDLDSAADSLQAFVNQACAQKGKKIDEDGANLLIATASQIMTSIGAEPVVHCSQPD